jgi:sRNA-binding regulator protein Hfq
MTPSSFGRKNNLLGAHNILGIWSEVKMSDIMIQRLKESEGKEIKLFLHNGFKYEGKLTNSDEKYVEIFDYKTKSYIIKEIIDIRNIEVKE